MSTTTDTPSKPRLLPVEAIQVPEGANPRRHFDPRALQELADSIAQHGMIQPLVVRCDDGAYTLIAGERRYRAAKLAGLEQVPVTLREGDESALELAVDENLHRQDLDPVEEAHAFQAILHGGKLTKKQLAARVSKTAAYANDRLRLLDLPEQIQGHLAAGVIPVRLAKQLIAIAKVSEPIAVAFVQLVANQVITVDELERSPERIVGYLGDYEWPDPQPIALSVSSYHRYPLAVVPLPAEGCDVIRERHAALGDDVGFCFDHQDADAARSYGCLLEFKEGRFGSTSCITDPAFIADRVRLKLDRYEEGARQARTRSHPDQERLRPGRPRRREGAAAPGAPAADGGEGGCDRGELRAWPQAPAPLRRTQDHGACREATCSADPRWAGGQARRARVALHPRGLADHRDEGSPRQDRREAPLPRGLGGSRTALRPDRTGTHPRAGRRAAPAGADRGARSRPERRRPIGPRLLAPPRTATAEAPSSEVPIILDRLAKPVLPRHFARQQRRATDEQTEAA